MNQLANVRSFVAVARRGSFSLAAADEDTTQPVISRRVAALEAAVGGPLFDRNTRQVALTSLGGALLSRAHALLRAERSFTDAARAHARGVVRLAVPADFDPHGWAAVRLRATGAGLTLDVVELGREERAVSRETGTAEAALVPVEPARANWTIPLGAAQQTDRARPLPLAALRPTRASLTRGLSRLVVLPEDAADPLLTSVRLAAGRAGLTAAQVHEAPGLIAAISGALAGDDWVLCSPAQATRWGLTWVAVPELPLVRGYRLDAEDGRRQQLVALLNRDIAAVLGADDGTAAGTDGGASA